MDSLVVINKLNQPELDTHKSQKVYYNSHIWLIAYHFDLVPKGQIIYYCTTPSFKYTTIQLALESRMLHLISIHTNCFLTHVTILGQFYQTTLLPYVWENFNRSLWYLIPISIWVIHSYCISSLQISSPPISFSLYASTKLLLNLGAKVCIQVNKIGPHSIPSIKAVLLL